MNTIEEVDQELYLEDDPDQQMNYPSLQNLQ